MTKKDFKNKKITIMGLGLNRGGIGSARFFAECGAKVLITDIKKERDLSGSLKKLKDLKIEYVLGQHRPEDFKNADMIIKNPAVPAVSKYLEIARENKIPIYSDIGIFLKLCKSPIIAVTGTKGKSTTASLIYQMLQKQYENVVLAGNIRVSVFSVLKIIKKDSLIILELSSWQLADLENIKCKPQVAVITNIFSDHLDRHKTFKNYVQAKKNIFKSQNKNNFLVLNHDNKTCRKLAKNALAKIIFFSLKSEVKGAHVIGNNIVFGLKKEFICARESLNLHGKHNLANALAAITASKIYNVKTKDIKKVLKNFRGLEGRLEFVKELGQVKYYNDTCATQPDAVIAGLKIFKKPIILIAGGSDKELEFRGMAQWILKKVKTLILLPGNGSDKIKSAIKKLGKKHWPIHEVDNMQQAVETAHKLAKPNQIVLLSPGCSSFSSFKHEFDRGDQFKKRVQSLKN